MLIDSDIEMARKMQDEKSIDILEFEIKNIKERIDKYDFIFEAGFVAGNLLCSVSNNVYDDINACLGGVNEFEEFIKEL